MSFPGLCVSGAESRLAALTGYPGGSWEDLQECAKPSWEIPLRVPPEADPTGPCRPAVWRATTWQSLIALTKNTLL